MKKIFTMMFLMLSLSILTQAQTLVTTQATNKNAVLEVFTGIHCQYCPQGDVIAETILENNPGRAAVLDIHQGSYASPSAGEPDYRTPFGDAIANQTGLTGYPSGTVNRHVFTGAATALDRGDWTPDCNLVMSQTSPVNLGVTSDFNAATRLLTVHVELYYTANSAVASNFINVALIQDHVFGPQTGGGAGNNYEHMNMLRYLVTGQWGDEVTTTTQGSLVERTYTYTVPAAYISIPCVAENCRIVAFVTQNHQEILTGDRINMIGGTNLYIGDISTADSTMRLGAPAGVTTFNMAVNSNLTGSEQFKIKLVSDAPADWNSSFTIDGVTSSDSTLVTLVKGTPKSFTLDVIPGATAGFQAYTFELTSVSNPNAPTKRFTVYVMSNVNTLIVNAAGDANSTQHQGVYVNGLTLAGSDKMAVMSSTLFQRATQQAILTEVLNVFYNVAWTFPSFTDPEALAVKAFVNNGGNLLVAGQDIGWDVMSGAAGSHGTPEAQDLYTNYLKAHFVNDGSTANSKLVANTTDVIYGMVPTANVVDVNSGNMYPDQISPLSDALTVFYYDVAKTKISALRSLVNTSKVIYFGAGLEMVSPDSTRNNILKKTWDWFMAGVGFDEKTAGTSSLSQNIPNPCNASSTIRFSLEHAGFASLKLYDINGKEIMTLVSADLPAGPGQVSLSTAGLNAGIYYYTLQTTEGRSTRKMVVVR